ncbi:hypothetical protein [Dapis sp. BLCC M229]|uniref:hypothetical protein n=1 Tax=Dapis sp. BLCC M229 TaxID=3400188 RepID=UPI003CF4E6F0
MTTNQRTTENSQNSRFKEPVSVDNLAENLMEDLFNDIDRVLDGGSRLPTEVTRPEIVSLTPIKVPQIVLPQKNTQSQDPEKEAKAKLAQAQATKKENKSLDKLLLGAAFASILVTLSLWLATRGGFDKILDYLGYVEKPDSSAETLNPKAAADAKFADYIERSLKMIEQKEATQKQQQLPGVPPAPSSNNLPKVPVSANPSINTSLLLPLNRLVDLMEAQVAKETVTIPETKVVVIPPIPTAVAVTPKSEPSSPKPSAASASNASKSEPSSPKPSAASASKASTEAAENAQEKSEAEITAKAEVKSETKAKVDSSSSAKAEAKTKPEPPAKTTAKQKPEPEQEPETTAQAESQTETPTQPVSLPPPPTAEIPVAEIIAASQVQSPINTLVGILELGERSAALFEIDGVARRIYVGESIGGSGWTLVKVANQEAVIRRNGEVRSVFVGQQF